MKAVAEVIGVSRSNLIERLRDRPKKRLGRPPLPDDELVADIKAVIAELSTAIGGSTPSSGAKLWPLVATRPITNGSTA
jgi:putative transposase